MRTEPGCFSNNIRCKLSAVIIFAALFLGCRRQTNDWSKEQRVAMGDILFGESPTQVVEKATAMFTDFKKSDTGDAYSYKSENNFIKVSFSYDHDRLYKVAFEGTLRPIKDLEERI